MELSSDNRLACMDVILQFFREEQWPHQKIENQPVFRAGYRGDHGTWVCYARLEEEPPAFLFHSLMGLNIATQFRPGVVEYLTRVNFLLKIGNFDMDLDSGNVRFRTATPLFEETLTLEKVRVLAYANVRTMDHYFPGVMAVVHGGMLPETALARIEPLPQYTPAELLVK